MIEKLVSELGGNASAIECELGTLIVGELGIPEYMVIPEEVTENGDINQG